MSVRAVAPASADSRDSSNIVPALEERDRILGNSSDRSALVSMDRERAKVRFVRTFSSSSRARNLLHRIERHDLPSRELPPQNSQVFFENLRGGEYRVESYGGNAGVAPVLEGNVLASFGDWKCYFGEAVTVCPTIVRDSR